MHTLAEDFARLPNDGKCWVHFLLGEHALSKWREYCSTHPSISYVETVRGTHQTVDTSLPDDAFASAQQGQDIGDVAARYQEPIAAMQDDDLEFPDPVTFAYYSLYNLFSKYAQREPIDDWLIVNQALSSEREESQWRSLLDAAIQKAK